MDEFLHPAHPVQAECASATENNTSPSRSASRFPARRVASSAPLGDESSNWMSGWRMPQRPDVCARAPTPAPPPKTAGCGARGEDTAFLQLDLWGSGHHSLVSGEQFANRHALHSSSLWLHQKASVEAQMVKNLPAMQETQVGSLGREDPLEKGMATTPVF